MWTEPNPAAQMRSILRMQLPQRAFLRRDRGENLFVSNAPTFGPVPEEIPGFHVRTEGNISFISPDAGWAIQLEEQFPDPPDHFSASLARFRGQPPTNAAMQLFISGLKLLDAENPDASAIALFDRAVRRHAAYALRSGSGGGCYALAVAACLLTRQPSETTASLTL